MSLDCLFVKGGRSNDPSSFDAAAYPMKRIMFYLVMPLAVLAAVLAARVLLKLAAVAAMTAGSRRVNQQPVQEQQADHMVVISHLLAADVLCVSALVVLFLFYPGLVRVSLSMFSCMQLDVAGAGSTDPYPEYAAVANATYGYWVPFIQQACWSGWHKAWASGLGVPCTVLFCIVVPGGLLGLLHANRRRLHQAGRFKECLDFLYHNYRPSMYLWEAVSIFQVATMVAISVFSNALGVYFSALLLRVSFAVVLVLQYGFRPYAFSVLNTTALLSLGCLYATSSFVLSLLHIDVPAPARYRSAVGVLALVLNLVFLLWCIYLCLNYSQGMVKQWWEVMQEVLAFM